MKILKHDCCLDAFVFFNQRSFQHSRGEWFVRYPKDHHIGPFLSTLAVTIQIIWPTPDWVMRIAQLEDHRIPHLEQSLNDSNAMSQNTSCHQINFGDFHFDAAHGCCLKRYGLESRAGLQSRRQWCHPAGQRADCFPNMFGHLVICWSGNRRAPWKRPLRLLNVSMVKVECKRLF